MIEDIHAALLRLRPGAEWSMVGDTLDGVTFPDGVEPVTQAELDAEIAEVRAAAVEREQQRAALLARLGLTADEFAVLVGGIA